MDYGHPLQFGVSITPLNDDPLAPVALAKQAEALGLDIVTVQDHPYQPRFHETWTLLSWIAGATSRISLSPHVLNVPMRVASVMARSAASLDLLSQGRAQLAVGAGAFWDAMVAMGVERLSAGESVAALEEAIEVMRGVWDLSTGRPLYLRGKHHAVTGIEPGPAPAHRIPIAVGAGKQRMLDLTGRLGDGWIVPGGENGIPLLAKGNHVIDEAARSVGRDPREIRRIVNLGDTFAGVETEPFSGQWESWVERMTTLALDDGVSTFLLSSDDPVRLELFATHVVPAVTTAVAAERAARETSLQPVVPLAVRAKRRSGIAYGKIPDSLLPGAVEPGDVSYGNVRSTYLRGGTPGLVLHPENAAQVADAVLWAQQQSVALSVRSGGHGFSGRSTNDGGIVIDLSRVGAIDVLNEAERLVRVEPGARWGEVAAVLRTHGWALSSGDFGGVGVGGLSTAGGIGFLSRAHGLTIDHVRAVDVVTANGNILRASATEHPDLFWAMRGAGFAFGVVTAFEFQVDEITTIGFGQLQYDVTDDVAGFLVRWGAAVEASPRDTTSFLMMGPPQDGRVIAQTSNVVASDDPNTILERLQRLADVAPLVGKQAMLLDYDALVSAQPRVGHRGRGEPTGRSGLLEHITPEFATAAEQLLLRGATSFFQIRALGGATADLAPEETAFAHRTAQFSVLAMSSSSERIDPIWDAMRHMFAGIYLSFETDQDPARLHDAFPPAHLERLRKLKRQYDPTNVFRDNFNLLPDEVRG